MSKQLERQESQVNHQQKLMFSVIQSYYQGPSKQGIQSIYSSHQKSKIFTPNYIRIENIQDLTEKEKETLTQIVKKLQDKIVIEFSQKNSNSKINNLKKQILAENTKVKESDPSLQDQKNLYPSLQVQDPKDLSNQFKVQLFKNLLKKKSAETIEMAKRIQQLEAIIGEMRMEKTNRQDYHQQETTKKLVISSLKEEKAKQQSQQLKDLKIEIQNKDKQINQLVSKQQMLESELTMKIIDLETTLMQKQKYQLMHEQSEKKFISYEQQHKRQIAELKAREEQKTQQLNKQRIKYLAELEKQRQQRIKNELIISNLREKVMQLEKGTIRTQHQKDQKNIILEELQKRLKLYMEQLHKFQIQKQKMQNNYYQLFKNAEIYKETIKQLTKQIQLLWDQQSQLKHLIQQRSQKILYLQVEVEQLRSISKDIQKQRQIFTAEVQLYKNNIQGKEIKIKELEQKNKKLQDQLNKKKHEFQNLSEKSQNHTNLSEKVLKIQEENKQKTHKLKQVEGEKDKLQTLLKKEMNQKIAHYENELKKVRMEKHQLQRNLQQQVEKYNKKYNILYQQSKKIKQASSSQEDKTLQLKKIIHKYQQDIAGKSYQLQNQKQRFQERMKIKQYEIAAKNTIIEQILLKNALLQQKIKNNLHPQTKEQKLNLFFELLKGFKSKMSNPQLNSLRSKIGFMMN